MAGGASPALSPARTDPVNELELLNQFKQGLGDLLEAVELELANPQRDPFAEVDPSHQPALGAHPTKETTVELMTSAPALGTTLAACKLASATGYNWGHISSKVVIYFLSFSDLHQ